MIAEKLAVSLLNPSSAASNPTLQSPRIGSSEIPIGELAVFEELAVISFETKEGSILSLIGPDLRWLDASGRYAYVKPVTLDEEVACPRTYLAWNIR